MSEVIKALKALREATNHFSEREWCDRAIAYLEAAKQPKPCACGGGAGTSGWSHSIHGCHHLPQQPARRVAQTVRREGPPAPATFYDDDLDDLAKAQQPARECTCEHCSGVIGEDDEFVITADDYWLHRKCAVGRPAHPQPCPDGEACPDARRWGNVHKQPAPADVPPMPDAEDVAFLDSPELAWKRLEALHAACVRIAAERDEARRELEAKRKRIRDLRFAMGDEGGWFDRFTRERARADKAEAELAALKGQEPVGEVVDLGDADGDFTCAALKSPMPSLGAVLYAAPVASIPLGQHEAVVAAVQGQVAEARREGLREAEKLVRRDAKRILTGAVARNSLIIAADGIRALAEKGGEGNE